MDGLIAYALSKKYVDGKTSSLATGMNWKGTKENINNLPQTGNKIGDLWHVNEDGNEYAWDGSKWEALGGRKELPTVDSALSDISENPVQNKVVKAALDEKGTYSKPGGGIPKLDLAQVVQTSLGKADTALQSSDLSYVTPEQYGAAGDGTTDDTEAIQAAVDSGKNVVFGYQKTYKCSTINVTKDIEIDCRWSEFVCTGETLFNCTGKVDSSVSGADYVANQPYVLLNDDEYTGFALLRSTDNVITMREYYYGGFVTLFSNGVCNDCRPVGFTGVTVDKITPIICKIRNAGNVVFDAVRDKNTVVKCTYGLNCEFDGFDVDGDYYSIVSLKKSYRCKVSRVNGYLTYTGSLTNYYAIGIDDSSECIVENCNLTSDWWHCYDVGGNYLCFDNVARNCSFFADSGAVAYNNHANGIGSIIENCEIDNMSVGAAARVINCSIRQHSAERNSATEDCRLDFHPTNVNGINTLYVDGLKLIYPSNSTGNNIGIYIRPTAYTTGNSYYFDGATIKNLSASEEGNLTRYPTAFYLTSNTSTGNLTVTGDVVLDNVIGTCDIHPTNTFPNITFAGDRKMLICNIKKVRSDGQGLFLTSTNSSSRFFPIVEVRDSIVWKLTGTYDTLYLYNVASTHYVMGGKATLLIGDNVKRLDSNSSILSNYTNARVTNMRYTDTSLWTYLYVSNGSGCYGLLGANGVEHKILE